MPKLQVPHDVPSMVVNVCVGKSVTLWDEAARASIGSKGPLHDGLTSVSEQQ
jgi:hypothetical protein